MENYNCPHCDKDFDCENAEGAAIFCPHCNQQLGLPSRIIQKGDQIGGFEIISRIGKGGMGNVYLARQLSMQRMVALKVISSEVIEDPKTKDQFMKEVQLSGRLNHPNIVTAIDAGEDKNTFFLAVNYIDGEDYEKRLGREFAISEKEALQIALTLSDALKYAWEKHNLLHKDIKPGNIIRDKRGKIFLLDLGIAQKRTGYSYTRKDFILGSPFYMSPEQARASDNISWSTDLYSLGATMYHMIIGVPPFDAADVGEIMKKHIEAPFPEPHSRNPNARISTPATELIRKMMQKKADNRFSSWDEFKEAVQKALVLLESPQNIRNVKTRTTTNKIPRQKSKISQKTATPPTGAASMMPPRSPDTKSTSSSILIINYGLIMATLLVVAFIVFKVIKSSQAGTSIRNAEEYARKEPSNFEEIKRRYQIAIEKSQGTGFADEANEKYRSALAAEEQYRKDCESFNAKMKQAESFLSTKEYDKALVIIEDLDKVKEHTQQQDVLRLKNMIKARMH